MRGAAVVLALALAAGIDADVEREWTIRRWAGDRKLWAHEVGDALRSAEWTDRYAALDAVARMPHAEPLPLDVVELAQASLADPHPNVRARALVTLRRHDREALPLERAERLAADPLPEVRLELARRLGSPGLDTTDSVLFRLAEDVDAGVADAARRALIGRGSAGASFQQALLGRLWEAGREETWFELVRLLVRNGEPTPLIARMSAHDHNDRSPRERSRRAMLAALELLCAGGEPESTNSFQLAPAFGARRYLVDGWLDPLSVDGSGAVERGRRELLLQAARRSGTWVGHALLGRLGREVPDEDAAGFLIEGALEALDANTVASAALKLDLDAATQAELWRLATAHATRWTRPAVEPWLASTRAPDVREAAATTLAQSLVARGDVVAGELLCELLEDGQPGLRQLAIDALTDARDPEPWFAALHADWFGREPQEQQALLARLSRDVAPTPFRDDLLLLGDESTDVATRSASLIELCQTFVRDGAVADTLARWLAEDLDALSRGASSGAGERGDRGTRELELRAQGLVRALHAVLGEGAATLVEDALEEALRMGNVEVAKICVQVLGRTDPGRRRLPRWIDDAVVQRVRIEAALWMGAEAPSPARIRAQNLLVEAYSTCDGELRARILKKLAELTDSNSLLFLTYVAGRDYPLEERGLALASLARRRPHTLSLPALAGVAEDVTELEVLRRAVEAIGTVGGAEARELLEILWSRFVDRNDVTSPPQRSREERELLREELILAFARVGDVSRDIASELLARPLAAADEELERRFAGRRGTSTEFAYRAELELCERLALEGSLGAALAKRPLWRLDARLALGFAERALDGAARVPDDRKEALRDALAAARALLQSAEVGFAGESLDDEGRSLWIRARVRLALLARAERRWGEAERRLSELLEEWRTGRLDERELKEVLGAEGGSSDAVRTLFESGLEQSRAWQAAEQGDLERAWRHAARARERAGRSESNWDAQRRLEAKLRR